MRQPLTRRLVPGVLAVALGAAVLSGCNGRAGSGLWARDLDPVVLAGSEVPALLGLAPGSIVAFRWSTERRGWEQVPVQVDERHVELMAKLRNGTGSSGPTTLAYSDAGANAGPDPVTTLDSNDEVAFMAADTGGPVPKGTSAPAGVLTAGATRVVVTDPLASYDPVRGSGVGYLYLFQRAGSGLDPAAGRDYVDYDFQPADPMGHTEDSTVTSDRYRTHFAARWVRDEIAVGGGPDVLDRHRNLFAVGVCGRSEDTFSAGDGGYATNVDGPVRVIRSYLGANSGTYTQREHVFYRGAERVQTFLRVHAIPGILDFYDYSPAAIGMTYASSSTPGGVTIDGVPDTAGTAPPTWEAVTGSQGAIVSTTVATTDIVGLTTTSYYRDDSTSPPVQCTGDADEYGASGTAITSAIPNTDPVSVPFNHFTATRWNVYVPASEPPDVSARVANLTTPLTTSAAPWVPGS